jgi:hypothetical protein
LQTMLFDRSWKGFSDYSSFESGWRRNYVRPAKAIPMPPERTGFVQVYVYSLRTEKMVWSASTRTTNSGGTLPLFEDVSEAVSAQMSADGVLY